MTLAEVEEQVRLDLARLNRPVPEFRYQRQSDGMATPHVEGNGLVWDWVVSERGIELERTPVDADELLFMTLSSMTGRMAQDEELRTRSALSDNRTRSVLSRMFRSTAHGPSVTDDYSRQTWMDAHVRLMSHLRRDWGVRVRHDYDATLRRFPLTPDERRNARRMDLTDFGDPA